VNSLTTLPQSSEGDVVSEEISFSNDKPKKGEEVVILAKISNSNHRDFRNIHVYFYEGDPDNGGNLFDVELIPYIEADNSYTVSVPWNTYVKAGEYQIYVVVSGNIGDTNDENNKISGIITVVDDVVGDDDDVVVGDDDDDSCFIATAAHGSKMEPHVKILRDFRDHFLLTNSRGRDFVHLYYSYSPALADFIAKHDTLRAIVRLSLLPIVGISWVALSLGQALTLALVILLLALMSSVAVFTVRWVRLRHQA
jgi:hypothetical protein